MNMKQAWQATEHGKAFYRPNGTRVEKWMGDKPGLPSAFDRFLLEGSSGFTSDDLMADDWQVEV